VSTLAKRQIISAAQLVEANRHLRGQWGIVRARESAVHLIIQPEHKAKGLVFVECGQAHLTTALEELPEPLLAFLGELEARAGAVGAGGAAGLASPANGHQPTAEGKDVGTVAGRFAAWCGWRIFAVCHAIADSRLVGWLKRGGAR